MIPEKKCSGDFIHNQPGQTLQLGDVNSLGNVAIYGKDGVLGNITSEGSIKITMSDSLEMGNATAQGGISNHAIHPDTPQHVLDFLSKRSARPTATTSSTNSTPILKDRLEEKKEPTLVDGVIGRIVRCTECGISSTQMQGGNKIGPSRNTLNGIEIKDPANRTHYISYNGVYKIINEGQGNYRMERVGDHDHSGL